MLVFGLNFNGRRVIYTIYKRIFFFGSELLCNSEIPLNLMFNREKTWKQPHKIYLQLHLKFLQNKTLSY